MNPGDLVNVLGRTLGLSLAAGINLYATVAILGLVTRFGWVDLPAQYRVFDNPGSSARPSASTRWNSSPTKFPGWIHSGMRSTR